MKPRILLVDDNDWIRENYLKSLESAGFEVIAICDGKYLEQQLVESKSKFDVVLCDTDMEELNGDEACEIAYEKGILSEDTLIIGMSDDSNNQQYWKGLAHFSAFIDKNNVKDIGLQVYNHLKNFNSDCAMWRRRMPKIEY